MANGLATMIRRELMAAVSARSVIGQRQSRDSTNPAMIES